MEEIRLRRKTTIKALTHLISLNQTAKISYLESLEAIESPVISASFQRTMAVHQAHMNALKKEVLRLGAEIPRLTLEFQGIVAGAAAVAASAIGISGALAMVRKSELALIHAYDEALDQPFPARLKLLLDDQRNMEAQHIKYIEAVQRREPWNKAM